MVPKKDALIQCLGELDELTSSVGVFAGEVANVLQNDELDTYVQTPLYYVMSALAKTPENDFQKTFSIDYCIQLEKRIDDMQALLPPLTKFILPRGHIHYTRSVCRRVERNLVLRDTEECANIAQYINRLSDYLFVLARFMAMKTGQKVKIVFFSLPGVQWN
jgi:cob(I)alamin adenosyltransferase